MQPSGEVIYNLINKLKSILHGIFYKIRIKNILGV